MSYTSGEGGWEYWEGTSETGSQIARSIVSGLIRQGHDLPDTMPVFFSAHAFIFWRIYHNSFCNFLKRFRSFFPFANLTACKLPIFNLNKGTVAQDSILPKGGMVHGWTGLVSKGIADGQSNFKSHFRFFLFSI
jgi:hypothetical protein